MAVRYDLKLYREISSIVNRYNQKIKRLEKKNNPFIIIPERITNKDIENLKRQVVTRTDLRRRLKEYERFIKRGGENTITLKSGVQLPKYEYQNIKQRQSLLKRRSKKILKISEETIYKTDNNQFTLKELGTEEYRQAKALYNLSLENIENKTLEDIKKYYYKLIKNTNNTDLRFYNNYKEILKNIIDVSDYDKKKGNEILNYIKKMNEHEFYQLFSSNEYFKQILYGYQSIKDIEIGYLVPSLTERLNDLYEDIIKDEKVYS